MPRELFLTWWWSVTSWQASQRSWGPCKSAPSPWLLPGRPPLIDGHWDLSRKQAQSEHRSRNHLRFIPHLWHKASKQQMSLIGLCGAWMLAWISLGTLVSSNSQNSCRFRPNGCFKLHFLPLPSVCWNRLQQTTTTLCRYETIRIMNE